MIQLDKIVFNYLNINDQHYVKMSQINSYNENKNNDLLKELKVQLSNLPNNLYFMNWSDNVVK